MLYINHITPYEVLQSPTLQSLPEPWVQPNLHLTNSVNTPTEVRGPFDGEESKTSNLELLPRQRRHCLGFLPIGTSIDSFHVSFDNTLCRYGEVTWISARRRHRCVKPMGLRQPLL